MNKRNLYIGAGAIALAIGWYAFRPELLFITKTSRASRREPKNAAQGIRRSAISESR